MSVPGGRSLGYVADTVLSITRSPGLRPGDLTMIVAKNRGDKMGNNLEVCNSSKFQIMVAPEKGDKWRFMPADWSSQAAPGEYVRRRFAGNLAPDGMVIAAIPTHQLNNDVPEFLILWFR